jgi:hypothetical protein
LIDPIPNLSVVGMEDVWPVGVERYTALDLGVAVTANVITLLNDHNLLALVVQMPGAYCTKETGSYN